MGLKQLRDYFFATTSTDRLRTGHKPTQSVLEDLLSSVPFFKEADSVATETEQGLLRYATDAQATAGNDAADANGYVPTIKPSQLINEATRIAGLVGLKYHSSNLAGITFTVTGAAAVEGSSFNTGSSHIDVWYDEAARYCRMKFKLQTTINPDNGTPAIWALTFEGIDIGTARTGPTGSDNFSITPVRLNVSSGAQDDIVNAYVLDNGAGRLDLAVVGNDTSATDLDMLQGLTANTSVVIEGDISFILSAS